MTDNRVVCISKAHRDDICNKKLRFVVCLTHNLVVFVTLRMCLVTMVAVKICVSLRSRLKCFYMRGKFVQNPYMYT